MEEDQDDPFLPPFANKENKALNALIKVGRCGDRWLRVPRANDAPADSLLHSPPQRLERQLEQVDQALEENNDRIGVMQEHLRNVQQELTYTESRVG